MAEHRLRYLLCAQRRAFLALRVHHGVAIYAISPIDHLRASPPAPEFVPGDFSNWTCDNHKYDSFDLRAAVGPGLSNLRLGAMVDQ